MPEPPFLMQVQTFYDELAADYHGRMCTLPADQPPIERAVLARSPSTYGPPAAALSETSGAERFM